MCLFHRWKETERFYAPPVGREVAVRGKSAQDRLERFLFGVTTLKLECGCGCGAVKLLEILGRASGTLL